MKKDFTYVYFGKLVRSIHSKTNLVFEKEKLSIMDVNYYVIKKFVHCKDNYQNILEAIKIICSDDEKYTNYEIQGADCIDLLGVYISPSVVDDTIKDNGNILLSKEKIAQISIKRKIDFSVLYNFVKMHEYAHAAMSPEIIGEYTCIENIFDEDVLSLVIEEGLATAIALKQFKNTSHYQKLCDFVDSQPPQYRIGLFFIEKFEPYIFDLMARWKNFKRSNAKQIKKELEYSKEYEAFVKKLDAYLIHNYNCLKFEMGLGFGSGIKGSETEDIPKYLLSQP